MGCGCAFRLVMDFNESQEYLSLTLAVEAHKALSFHRPSRIRNEDKSLTDKVQISHVVLETQETVLIEPFNYDGRVVKSYLRLVQVERNLPPVHSNMMSPHQSPFSGTVL